MYLLYNIRKIMEKSYDVRSHHELCFLLNRTQRTQN